MCSSQVEQGKMHVKELLFTQKLERNQAAQVLEQKRALSDQLDATQAETRSLKHALQLEKSTTASMEARMRQADDGIGSLTLARSNPSQASLEHVNSQINSLKALNDDLWERLHAANKERADAAERISMYMETAASMRPIDTAHLATCVLMWSSTLAHPRPL